MPIVTGFGCSLECEVHVLSGMSTVPLRDFLWVVVDGDGTKDLGRLSDQQKRAFGIADVVLWASFLDPDRVPQTLTVAHGNGVDIDLETGRVVAKSVAAGKRRMRNFLLWAKLDVTRHIPDTWEMPIEDDSSALSIPVGGEGPGNGNSGGGGSTTVNPSLPFACIRVHIHDRIQRCWLTPERLRIASGSAGASPRLLAEFDDGVVADITDWASVIDGLSLGWTSANPAHVRIGDFGQLLSTSTAGSTLVDVSATLSHPILPAGSIRSAPLKAYVVEPWSQPRPVKFISGPGPRSYLSTTNLLFIAEGFGTGEELMFYKMVSELTDCIVRSEYMQPFKLLKQSINFWALFVASDESGTTLLSEHIRPKNASSFTLHDNIEAVLNSLLDTEPKYLSDGNKTFNQALKTLIRNVGIPAPGDFGNNESDTDAFARLKPLLEGDLVPPTTLTITADVFAAWRSLARRSLVESRNTLFAVQSGGRPFAGRKPPSSPSLDYRRIASEDISAVVGALYCDVKVGGATQRLQVGKVWERPVSGSPGKDVGQVCILSRATSFGSATSTDPYSGPMHIISKLWRHNNGKEYEMAETQPGKPTFVLHPGPVQKDYGRSSNLALSVVHEFGHVFGLVDEYGGLRPTEQVNLRKFPNAQWRFDLFRRTGDPVGPYDPASRLPATQPIWPSKIRWAAWSRLHAAGVLAERPTFTSSGVVRVKLLPNHTLNFEVGKFVQFRQRPLLNGQLPAATSVAMRITEKLDGDILHLEPNGSFTAATTYDFDIITNKPPPILIQALLSPGTTAPANRVQPLVAPEILAHIGASGGPLNADPDLAALACTPATSPVASQFPSNLPTTLTRTPAMSKAAFRKQNIVGLYQGGLGLNCGAYHPAGDCMMRGAAEVYTVTSQGEQATTEFRPFCHVCRYWLVDRIDPSKHRELDDLYDPYYPGQRPYE